MAVRDLGPQRHGLTQRSPSVALLDMAAELPPEHRTAVLAAASERVDEVNEASLCDTDELEWAAGYFCAVVRDNWHRFERPWSLVLAKNHAEH
jgi:hypothetical protein